MIFSYGLLFLIEYILKWRISEGIMLGICILLFGAKELYRRGKEKRFPVNGLLGSVGIVVLLFLLMKGYLVSYLQHTLHYWMRYSGTDALKLYYGLPILVGILVLGNLCFALLCRKHTGKIILVAGVLTAIVITTCYGVIWSPLALLAWLYIGLKLGLEEYLFFRQREDRQARTGNIALILLVLLLVTVIPYGDKPISWERVRMTWNQTKEAVNELVCDLVYWGQDSYFGVDNVGFSNQDNSFWGRLTNGANREMMTLSIGSSTGAKETYFVGTIKEHYQDNAWSRETEPYQGIGAEYDFALREKLYYLYQAELPSDENTYFCQTLNYTITYRNLHTDTLFLPRNCSELQSDKVRGTVIDQGANTLFDEEQKNKNQYVATGISMNLKNDALIAYLRNWEWEEQAEEKTSDSTLFDECVASAHIENRELEQITAGTMPEQIAAYEEQVRRKDCALPDSIPNTVYALAEDITEGCDNDYDRMQAIVKYLKKDGGFTYTLSPEEASEGEEEMAYFLCEDRRGYCSHFASAAAILCRCVDIPARVVEGAVVSYQDMVNKNGVKSVSIYGKDAHAWTQVYLSGFGWYDVDATPGYSIENGDFHKANSNYMESQHTQQMSTQEPEEQQTHKTHRAKKISWEQVALYAAAVTAGSVILLAVFLLLRQFVVRYRYTHRDNRAKCEWCMRQILQHRKARGVGMEADDITQFPETLLWYEAVRYGRQEVREEDVLRLEELVGIEKKYKRHAKNTRSK